MVHRERIPSECIAQLTRLVATRQPKSVLIEHEPAAVAGELRQHANVNDGGQQRRRRKSRLGRRTKQRRLIHQPPATPAAGRQWQCAATAVRTHV